MSLCLVFATTACGDTDKDKSPDKTQQPDGTEDDEHNGSVQLTEEEWKAAFELLRNSDNYSVNIMESESENFTQIVYYEIDGNKIKECYYDEDYFP